MSRQPSQSIQTNHPELLHNRHKKLHQRLPTRQREVLIMRERRKNTPQHPNRDQRQRTQHSKIDVLIASLRVADVFHGDDDKRAQEQVDEQEDDDADLGVFLAGLDLGGAGVCFVDSAHYTQDQSDHGWQLRNLNNATSSRVGCCPLGDQTCDSTTCVSGHCIGLSADMVGNFICSGAYVSDIVLNLGRGSLTLV